MRRRRRERDGARFGAIGAGVAGTPGDGTPDAWRSDAWWFAATAAAPYPDALHRIARGFELAENPASAVETAAFVESSRLAGEYGLTACGGSS